MTVHAEPSHKFTVKIAGQLRTIQGYTHAEYQMARAELIDDLQGDVELAALAEAAGNAAAAVVVQPVAHAPFPSSPPTAGAAANPWQAAAAPVGPPAPPPVQGQAPSCIHGPMTFRSGVGKNGPWSGYMCPTPKGTPNQCKAIYL